MRPLVDFNKQVDYSNLKGKSILITGGASGIGALITTAFAKHGAFVTIADLNETMGQELTKTLAEESFHTHFVRTDVSDWSSQVSAFKSAIAFSKRDSIDIVVAVAGLPGTTFVESQEEAPSLDKDPPEPKLAGPTFDVNAKGVYYTTKLAQHYFALKPKSPDSLPAIRKSVILISSLAGYLEINCGDYTSTKWAVRGLFRSVRSKMEDLGYRVNLIAPWVMDRPMSKSLADFNRKHGFPVGDANDVAKAVIRCAADDDISGEFPFLSPTL